MHILKDKSGDILVCSVNESHKKSQTSTELIC